MSASSTSRPGGRAWAGDFPCTCANVRRLARLSTRLYDDALKPYGIEVGQFGLLACLARVPSASPGELSEILGMDPSSLTRTLARLQRRGWVDKRLAPDRRGRRIRLTAAGRVRLARAVPAWRAAQRRFEWLIGGATVLALTRAVGNATLALTIHSSTVVRRSRRPGPSNGRHGVR